MENSHSIVVVDDDPSMGLAMERLLGAAGWHTVTFASAEALLESGTAESARGFILDIQLPGISGFELFEKLQVAGIKVPVIFITAHDRPWVQVKAEEAGAAGYFTKPFNGRSLIEALARNCVAA